VHLPLSHGCCHASFQCKVIARLVNRLDALAIGPVWVSNNSFEKSLFASILSRNFFDTQPSPGLVAAPTPQPHGFLRMSCHSFFIQVTLSLDTNASEI
jgi:hypothetical protein